MRSGRSTGRAALVVLRCWICSGQGPWTRSWPPPPLRARQARIRQLRVRWHRRDRDLGPDSVSWCLEQPRRGVMLGARPRRTPHRHHGAGVARSSGRPSARRLPGPGRRADASSTLAGPVGSSRSPSGGWRVRRLYRGCRGSVIGMSCSYLGTQDTSSSERSVLHASVGWRPREVTRAMRGPLAFRVPPQIMDGGPRTGMSPSAPHRVQCLKKTPLGSRRRTQWWCSRSRHMSGLRRAVVVIVSPW